ncbi:phage tail-collar fiber domain-containing protein [Pseudoalteromonas xiamenensis]
MSHTEYWTTLTANGRQKVLAAIAQQGKIEISHFAVGDGTIGESHTDLTSLKYRNEISSLHVVSGESALVEMFAVVPANVGGFYVREGAFYTSDGEAFAIIKYPETYKPDASDNAAAELGIRAIVDVEQAQVVTEKIDPSMVYASREWVKRTLSNDLAVLQDEIEKNAANLTALDSKLNIKGIATKWQDLTGSVGHAFETEYNGEKYVVKNPMDDVAIAPPDVAGRSYFEFKENAIKIPTIQLIENDVVNLKWVDGGRFGDPFGAKLIFSGNESGTNTFFGLTNGGNTSSSSSFRVLINDQLTPSGTPFSFDGFEKRVSITVLGAAEIDTIGARFGNTHKALGCIYDLEVIRGGQRIHYFPLRTDAIDYLAGNLVKDEEFTYTNNFIVIAGSPTVKNNKASGKNGDSLNLTPVVTQEGTYRLLMDYSFSSGGFRYSVGFNTDSPLPSGDSPISGNGKDDRIVVVDGISNANLILQFLGTGDLSNFRVIKLNELSPSASFSGATGFGLSGGVTITGGQAVFGSGSGVKNLGIQETLKAGKRYRVAYKTTGRTKGTYYFRYGSSTANVGGVNATDGTFDFIVEPSVDGVNALIYTNDGWDGNVQYFSVTEVTDGEIIGELVIAYENHWAKQLDSKDIGSKSDIDAGTSTKIVPHVKAVKEALIEQTAALQSSGIGTIWQDLTGSIGHAFETEYNGEKYVVKNPMDDVAIAPPDVAGRSYVNFTNGTYVKTTEIPLLSGYKVKLKVLSEVYAINQTSYILDNSTSANRLFFNVSPNGNLVLTSGVSYTLDGVQGDSNTKFPSDGLWHTYEITLTTDKTLAVFGAAFDLGAARGLDISDVEIFNDLGQRIHYYPLRTDAIDYLAGNLVKDEELTYSGNWEVIGNPRIENNSVVFDNPAGTNAIRVNQTYIGTATTFRLVCDVARTSGELVFGTVNSTGVVSPLVNINSSGKTDSVFVASLNGLRVGLSETSFDFIGAVKNFRVIPMVELSPSASFKSASGLDEVSSGVTFNSGYVAFDGASTNKQVVFNGAYRFSVKAGQSFRFALKVNGATKGTLRAQSLGASDANVEFLSSGDGVKSVIITAIRDHLFTPFLITVDGWNGNVEYWSVTEVTDGEVIGEPEIVYENHWAKQLDSKDIGSKSDIDAGISTKIVPHVKAVKEALIEQTAALQSSGIGTIWQDLTGSIGHAFETEYNGEKYVVKNPMDDVAIAPPNFAGRSYIEQNGTNSYIKLKSPIVLQAGDEVKFKFEAPTSPISSPTGFVLLIDSGDANSRLTVSLQNTGEFGISTVATGKLDGISITNTSKKYPTDGLIHEIELKVVNSARLGTISARYDYTSSYKGRIYDLEVIRGGQRIHYYPLRTDAIDYLAGNLVKDEEFTSADNFLVNNTSIANNRVVFNGSASAASFRSTLSLNLGDTVRVIYELEDVLGGTIRPSMTGSQDLTSQRANGKYDEIAVLNNNCIGAGLYSLPSDMFNGKVKNFRVIKLNELSPSASFSSSTGFTLVGGVTITGGQAVFGSEAGTKAVRSSTTIPAGTKIRVAYKFNNRTKGSIRAYSLYGSNGESINALDASSNGTIEVFSYALLNNSVGIGLITTDGWDGNVEYFSVTEVTDGEVIGEPEIVYENHWAKQLDGKDIGSKSDIDTGTSTKIVPHVKAVKEAIDSSIESNVKAHGVGTRQSLQSNNFITRSFDLNIAGGSRVPFPDLPDNACDILVHGLTDGTETYTPFVGRFVKYGSTWSAVNIYGATGSLNYPTIEIFNNKPHFKNPHVYAFSFSFNCQIACQNAGAARPFEFYQNLYSPTNLPTKLVDGSVRFEREGSSYKVSTQHGTGNMGCANSYYYHFSTSAPAFYFDRPLHVRGEIYAGATYDKKVYHEGNKPTASDVGAFKEHKRGITVSNSEYTTIAKVTGERFSSIITMTLFGTADSTVVSFKADLLVHHFKQVYVYSQNGGYSAISLKILSDSNEKYCIQAMVIGSKSAPLICTIQAFANEMIEFNPADISGFTNEHIHNSRKYGYAITSKYASTGISINGNEVADAGNIHHLLQSSVSKPTSGNLSLGENHLTTSNTIKLPATTNLAVDSVVKVTKRFAVTPQIEVDNPTTDKIAFFKDRVVQFDISVTFDVGAILTFILNDKKEWELQ